MTRRCASKSLDHPALAVRLESQRILERKGPAVVPLLVERLKAPEPETGRLHALWALDAIGGADARRAIGSMLADPSPRVRLQAARSVGIRRDRAFLEPLLRLLTDRDAAVRREAAIAAGRLGDLGASPALYAALGDSDTFAAWSVRQAIRRLNAWNKQALVEALLDERRLESALRLTDEAWAVAVVAALTEALNRTTSIPVKARIVANLAGLYSPLSGMVGPVVRDQPAGRPVPPENGGLVARRDEGSARRARAGSGRPRQRGPVPGDRRLERGGPDRGSALASGPRQGAGRDKPGPAGRDARNAGRPTGGADLDGRS